MKLLLAANKKTMLAYGLAGGCLTLNSKPRPHASTAKDITTHHDRYVSKSAAEAAADHRSAALSISNIPAATSKVQYAYRKANTAPRTAPHKKVVHSPAKSPARHQ